MPRAMTCTWGPPDARCSYRGLGLLFDAAGNDRYASHGFALGFGGPQGVGAAIDLQGDDEYQCGNKYALTMKKTLPMASLEIRCFNTIVLVWEQGPEGDYSRSDRNGRPMTWPGVGTFARR